MGTVESFVHLFRGRGDAHGSWGGGCVREALTPDHFVRHLHSHFERDWIGVYNVIGTECSWGVVDIDVPALLTIRRIRAALNAEHIPAWIEQTTRGFHLWVFPAAQLIDAATMRQALTAACLRVGYKPKEVFPKQDRASGDRLGNYVRLPLNGSAAKPPAVGVRRFVHQGVSIEDMDRNRAATVDLQRLAALAPVPQHVDISVDINAGLEVEPVITEIGGRAYKVWRDGPAWEHDRSSTLAHLAHLLHEGDIDATTAYAIVASADDRWGKGFLERPTGAEILLRIVSNAYGQVAS